jgi:hypothetical protein
VVLAPRGILVWWSALDDIFLSADMGDSKRLHISSISHRTYRLAVGSGLGGDRGYFIFETDESIPDAGINVLAKVASYEAGMRLFELLALGARRAA